MECQSCAERSHSSLNFPVPSRPGLETRLVSLCCGDCDEKLIGLVFFLPPKATTNMFLGRTGLQKCVTQVSASRSDEVSHSPCASSPDYSTAIFFAGLHPLSSIDIASHRKSDSAQPFPNRIAITQEGLQYAWRWRTPLFALRLRIISWMSACCITFTFFAGLRCLLPTDILPPIFCTRCFTQDSVRCKTAIR